MMCGPLNGADLHGSHSLGKPAVLQGSQPCCLCALHNHKDDFHQAERESLGIQPIL